MTTNNGAPMGVGRRPGAWPVKPSFTEADTIKLSADRTRERFRAHLDLAAEGFREQPSPRAIRSAGRRLCTAITALADEMATAIEKTMETAK